MILQVSAVVVYQEAYQLAKKEHTTLQSNPSQLDNEGSSPPLPTRDRVLDEELFLRQLLRVASVLNPGFQAAVLERICDHLYTAPPDGSLQGGSAADDFFHDWDLFHTECICIDPAVGPSQPADVAAIASLSRQDDARPQAENAATPMGAVPVFSRARSAGDEVRPRLVGPEPWTARNIPLDIGEANASGGLGFTRSRSAADGEEAAAAAAGRSVGRGWEAWHVGSVFTRSRYQNLNSKFAC
jgi:hypothetical protein